MVSGRCREEIGDARSARSVIVCSALELVIYRGENRLAASRAVVVCCHPACGMRSCADGVNVYFALLLAIARRMAMAALRSGALLPWRALAGGCYGSVPIRSYRRRTWGVVAGSAARGLVGRGHCLRGMEHRRRFPRRNGALICHACSRHGRTHYRELLSRSWHGGGARFGAARRAPERICRARPSCGIDRMLAR